MSRKSHKKPHAPKAVEHELPPPPNPSGGTGVLRVIVIIQLLFIAASFQPQLTTNGDDAKYLVLSQALAQGEGYRDIANVNKPPESQYPPVFPVLLSLFSLFTDTPLLGLCAVSFLSVLLVLLSSMLFRRSSDLPPLYIVVPLAFSWLVAEFGTALMSEMPYIVASLGALLLYQKSIEEPSNRVLFWAAIAMSLLPAQCRSIGISFSAAWIVSNLYAHRYRYALVHAAVLALSVVVIKSFTSWDNPYVLQLFERDSYNPEAGLASSHEMRVRIVGNAIRYVLEIIPKALSPIPGKVPLWLVRTLGISLSALIGIGWVRMLFLRQKLAGIYTLFYGLILLLWQQQWSSERFLAGIVPFLYLFLMDGIAAVLAVLRRVVAPRRAGRRHAAPGAEHSVPWRAAIITCIAAIVIVNAWFHLSTLEARRALGPDWRNFYSCADWVRLNTPADAVVVSRKPELFFLRAKRAGFIYPYSHDVEKVIASLRGNGATHVVFDNFSWTATSARYLYPAIAGHPELFRVVYALKNPDTFVLEFVKK